MPSSTPHTPGPAAHGRWPGPECTCGPESRPAFCPAHRCDCNIMCDCTHSRRPHIFAPGEWCGNGRTWTERRPGGTCGVHPAEAARQRVPAAADSTAR